MDSIIFFILIFGGTYFVLTNWNTYGSFQGYAQHLYTLYMATGLLTKLIVFFLAFLYINYRIFKWKQNDRWTKYLRNFSIYFSIIIIAYFSLKYFNPGVFDSIFNNPLLARASDVLNLNLILAYLSTLLTLAALLLHIGNRIVNPKSKGLKHGPNFTTGSRERNGIEIGRYNRDILPKHIRNYARRSKAPVIIPFKLLSRGVTVLGSMGCGKSRLMQAIHDKISEKYPDIPILVNDPKGEWLRTYYNPKTDLIFAPNDKRSCGWKLWEDFKNIPELLHTMINTSITAHSPGINNDRFWSDSAIYLLRDMITDNTPEEARQILLSRKEAKPNDRTFQSIYATAILGFRDMITTELGSRKTMKSYTIKELMNWKGRIFLLNSPSCSDEQKGALTLFLSAFLMQALNQPDTENNELRAAAVIDEALGFNLPPSVETAIYTQCRSKGLSIIAGAQRLPNKDQGERGEWSTQAGHLFGMRIGDLNSREALSRRLGKIIYEEEQKATTDGKGNKSTTKSKARRSHKAIEPEDFGALKNREFVLFHESGIAVGNTINVNNKQRNEIPVFLYDERKDVHEFMRILL